LYSSPNFRSQILVSRAGIQAEGVGEGDRAINAHAIAVPAAHMELAKITEAVSGKKGGVFKRGDEEVLARCAGWCSTR